MEKREFREERGKHMESGREGGRKVKKSMGGGRGKTRGSDMEGSNLLNNI